MKRTTSLEDLTLEQNFYRLGSNLSIPHKPQGISQPKLLRRNNLLAEKIGLSPKLFDSRNFLKILCGNRLLQGSRPIAQAYAGHQFGTFNPFLGDGRSIMLGELETPFGFWELSLKGAGKTPYTFASDGRASVSECLHEYTMSERLSSLGIPVIRCLSLIQGTENIYRSGFEPIAILCRLSPSFVRFGSFENCYFKKDYKALKVLTDYIINQHFKDCLTNGREGNNYARFFQKVVVRTARLIANWQAAGFVHGMMNTDNQSILGLTLDLGESALLKAPSDDTVVCINDRQGRYAFGQQPIIGLWNCNVLAQALSPLIKSKDLKASLSLYEQAYLEHFNHLKSVSVI